jgi:hypothetical protein
MCSILHVTPAYLVDCCVESIRAQMIVFDEKIMARHGINRGKTTIHHEPNHGAMIWENKPKHGLAWSGYLSPHHQFGAHQ